MPLKVDLLCIIWKCYTVTFYGGRRRTQDKDLKFRTLLARVGSAYSTALLRHLSEGAGYRCLGVHIMRLLCAACVLRSQQRARQTRMRALWLPLLRGLE